MQASGSGELFLAHQAMLVHVFLLVFTAFGVPVPERHKLLTYGIIGALAMRAVFIVVGAAILHEFGWVSFIFAALLGWTAWRMFKHRHDHEGEDSWCARSARASRRPAWPRSRRSRSST